MSLSSLVSNILDINRTQSFVYLCPPADHRCNEARLIPLYQLTSPDGKYKEKDTNWSQLA